MVLTRMNDCVVNELFLVKVYVQVDIDVQVEISRVRLIAQLVLVMTLN